MKTITEQEIKAIDNRIKDCSIENPEFENDKFWCKIWFNWKWKSNDKIHTDGRHEFVSFTKADLVNQVKNHLNNNTNNYEII